MSGGEFVAAWVFVIGTTVAIVGWAFLMAYKVFPHDTTPAIVFGVAPWVVILIVASWFMLRDG